MENNILKHRQAVQQNIMKSFGAEVEEETIEKGVEEEINPFEMEAYKAELTKAELDEFEKAKHNDGDIHPNGKWVWRASANGGKGDWRVMKNSGGKTVTTSTSKTSTVDKQSSEKKSNTVTHDINGTKVTVTKNSDGSYTLEANGKKVKSDDPSFFVNGTNIKPRVKAALAKEVGLEMKKNSNTSSSLSLKEKRELRKKVKESSNFAAKMEDEVVKHFGAELKKKYGSDDFSDIYDKVGEDKFDDVFMSYVYRLYKKE